MIKLMTACAVSAAIMAPVSAQAFYLDTEVLRGEAGRDAAPLVTMDVVDGINGSIAGLAHRFSDRLGMDEASVNARGTFFAISSLLAFSVQRTNAIVIGHEGAHFHFAGLNGRPNHSFIGAEGEEISWLDAWGSTFLTGSVGGPARSWGDPADVTVEGRITANNAGNNWQADYADRLHRRAFAGRDANVFSAMDYLFSANHWLTYAIGDKRRGRNVPKAGDVLDLVDHLESEHAIDGAMDQIVKWSALTSLLSAANWQAFSAINSYIVDGDTGLFDGAFTWNATNYGYHDSFSVAATAQMRLPGDAGVWSVGAETAVIGESWTEVTVGAYKEFGRNSLEGLFTAGRDGSLVELRGERQLVGGFSLMGSAAVPVEGNTRRAERLLPDGEALIRVGLGWSF